MTGLTILILVVFALNAITSLGWLAQDEIPQPPPRTRRKVLVALVIELAIVTWASVLLFR